MRVLPEREYALSVLGRYWPHGPEAVVNLAIPHALRPAREMLPPQGVNVALPDWAADVGVQGQLWVPAHTVGKGEGPAWRRVDWLEAVFWYVSGAAETAHEALHGPIHSYSSRLAEWDERFWTRAWVNRIALFLRRWASRHCGSAETSLFGQLPDSEVVLTHDVDAVTKTAAVRLKQTGFHVYNALRSLRARRYGEAVRGLREGIRFLARPGDYWRFEEIMELEAGFGLRSHFNIYGGSGGWRRTPKQLLLDPAYSTREPRVRRILERLRAGGWTIGLHPSFDSWNQPAQMRRERRCLEEATGGPVHSCRQHWLRFSWRETWGTQEEAGLHLDTTLGFNDRSAFRTGCALRFHPWDFAHGAPRKLQAVPLVLMDSHLFDYTQLSDDARRERVDYWIDEINAVRGVATVVWHQRVLSEDYGWGGAYRDVLSKVGNGSATGVCGVVGSEEVAVPSTLGSPRGPRAGRRQPERCVQEV